MRNARGVPVSSTIRNGTVAGVGNPGAGPPALRNWVLAATSAGSVALVLGAIRRYAAESAPPPPAP